MENTTNKEEWATLENEVCRLLGDRVDEIYKQIITDIAADPFSFVHDLATYVESDTIKALFGERMLSKIEKYGELNRAHDTILEEIDAE